MEYIEEEYGHHEWILNDIEACGGDRQQVKHGRPCLAIELMVAFLYDQIQRGNPAAFFGMVMVLEGTSIQLATQMGQIVQSKLDLPAKAFSYLFSHGSLDLEHFKFFENLMDQMTHPEDQQAIVHAANVVYQLYGDMLHAIRYCQPRKEPTMQLRGQKVLLTGATGGIGKALARVLSQQGARLILVGRNVDRLVHIAHELKLSPQVTTFAELDLGSPQVHEQALAVARSHPDIDLVVNCAGMNLFAASDTAPAAQVAAVLDVNLKGTILLTQALLPGLLQRPEAAVVNVGSTFGSIGYPGFAAYCASKFGLRGYTEALRRELANSSVRVFYIAPRATATDMNEQAVRDMNVALGNAMDTPEQVAARIVQSVQREKMRVFIGWPEKFFVFMNGLMSSVVDKALIKQLPVIQRFLLKGVR
ncbi:MAG: SDR family oxidoreductase [Gammaproteobacteria bacterium]